MIANLRPLNVTSSSMVNYRRSAIVLGRTGSGLCDRSRDGKFPSRQEPANHSVTPAAVLIRFMYRCHRPPNDNRKRSNTLRISGENGTLEEEARKQPLLPCSGHLGWAAPGGLCGLRSAEDGITNPGLPRYGGRLDIFSASIVSETSWP